MDEAEFLDGFALWQEHQPQTGEDWVKVAERVIADGDSTDKGSPLFAAVGIAVRERNQLRQDQDLDLLLAGIREHRSRREQHPKGPSKRNARLWKLAQEIEERHREKEETNG